MAAARMWPSASRPARVAVAASGSSNTSADTLLEETISASVASRRTMAARKARMSKTMNVAAAKARASPLASMATRVSFWRMERSRSGRMPLTSSGPRPRHERGQLQELGAQLQARLLRPARVDLEADLVGLDDEVDVAAVVGEAVGVSHDEDAGPVQGLEDGREVLALGRADEDDLGLPHLVDARQPAHLDTPAGDRLAGHGLVEHAPEGIAAEHGDDEGLPRAVERVGGPLDEACEVEEEARLHLVFARGTVRKGHIGPGARGHHGQDEGGHDAACGRKIHATSGGDE